MCCGSHPTETDFEMDFDKVFFFIELGRLDDFVEFFGNCEFRLLPFSSPLWVTFPFSLLECPLVSSDNETGSFILEKSNDFLSIAVVGNLVLG